ncbi:MAG: LuxR C-terminal-related transcriptional regulator, partial [Chloroflexota bacterium]
MEQDRLFSEREKQVIEHLIQGKSNKQIALALGISVRGVEFHLSNIYARLEVSSRTEAAMKLTENRLWKSTGNNDKGPLRESAVVELGTIADNDGKPVSTRRLPLKNLFFAAVTLLATTLIVILALANMPAKSGQTLPAAAIVIKTVAPTLTATLTPQPARSSRGLILEQMRQLAAEYQQNIQAEKKNGKVEASKDPATGDDIYLFKDESFTRVYLLSEKMSEKFNQLNTLYTQVYRNEIKPTPFPTQPTEAQNKAYYDTLSDPAAMGRFCSVETWVSDPGVVTLHVFALDDGKDRAVYIGDVSARCDVYGQMLEELRTAPMLTKVNQSADMAQIRQVINQPDLKLTFQSISGFNNAAGRNAALYMDETGAKYYMDIDTGRLGEIVPNYPSHPEIPSAEAKSMVEL